MTDARLEVQIDGRGAVQGSNVSVRALRNLEGQAGRVHGAFDRMQRSIFSLRGALTGLAGAFAFRELTRTLDAWTQYETRLRLVTDSTGELINVQEALFELAQDTRTEFGATVELYARVARSADQLGLSQQNLLELTETVQQSIQIGGATAQEAAAGVVQFSQALASGELRGDEFRSLSENLQGLRNALIDGLNEVGTFGDVTIRELRELSAEGQLTTDVISEALLAVADDVEATYGLMPRTIAQAVTQLQNDMLRVVGTLDDGSGASDRFVEAIDRVRAVVVSPDFVNGISVVVEGLALMAENMDAVVIVGTTLIGLRLGAAFGPWGAGIGAVTGALAGLIVNQRTANSVGAESEQVARRLAEAYELMAQGANEAAAAELRLIGAQGQRGIASLRVDIQAEQDRVEALQRELAGITPTRATFAEDEHDLRRLSGEIVAANQNIVSMEGDISDLHGQMAEATRQTNNLAAGLDAVAAPTSSLSEITEDLTGRYTDFVAAGNDAFRMQQEINAVLAEYTDIQGQLAEAQNEAFFAGDIERSREIAEQMERLRLSQAEQIQQIEDRYMQAIESATSAMDAFGESLGRVKGPGDEFEETVKKVADGADEVADEWRQVGGAFSSALQGAILNGEDFRAVLAGIAEDLARLAIQQATLAAFGGGGGGGNFFGDLIGGIGALLGFGGTPKVGVKHAGGRGDDFQRFTRASLAGDERLTVIRTNERVLTLGQQQRMGGSAPGVTVNIIDQRTGVADDALSVQETIGADGGRQVRVFIRDAVRSEIAQQSRVGGMLNRV